MWKIQSKKSTQPKIKKMKKSILFLFVSVFTLTLFGFSKKEFGDKYPKDMPADYVEILKKDFIKTMDSKSLIDKLEKNFHPLFDEINSVDAQLNSDFGYYYIVFGKKDNQDKVEILKINNSDIENNTYTYINFENVHVSAATEYCLSGPDSSPFRDVCIGPCAERDNCWGSICGILLNGVCVNP